MNALVQPDPGLYIWTIITFVLLLVAFNKLAWRPLMATLRTREESIQKALDDARQAKEELARLRRESQQILADARTQADKIISDTRSDASRFRDELKQKAQDEARAIVTNAEKQIGLETARAVQQIRHEAVELSVAIASKILQRNVTNADSERLIEETFRQLETTRPS